MRMNSISLRPGHKGGEEVGATLLWRCLNNESIEFFSGLQHDANGFYGASFGNGSDGSEKTRSSWPSVLFKPCPTRYL